MSDILPTVTIMHPSGSCIINEDDFDPKIHTLFDAKPEPQQGATPLEPLDAKALRKMARGLGVTFGPRTSDEKLIADINAAKGA